MKDKIIFSLNVIRFSSLTAIWTYTGITLYVFHHLSTLLVTIFLLSWLSHISNIQNFSWSFNWQYRVKKYYYNLIIFNFECGQQFHSFEIFTFIITPLI